MRIGIIVPGFSSGPDDWCIPALRHLVARLARAEDLRVIALRYPYRSGRYDAFGATVTALGGGGRQRTGSARVWFEALRVIVAEHRRRPFDVLHAFWANETGALAALAGRWLGIPSIVSLAGGELVGFRDINYGGLTARSERIKVRLALGLAGYVSAGSHYLLDRAKPWLAGRPTPTIRRIPLGVDLDLFQPAPAPAEKSVGIVHAASLSPVKDQVTLLRALAGLPRRGRDEGLAIAGKGPAEGALRDLAGRLGIAGAVRWRGEIPHDRLAEFYRGGQVFALSSRHEAQCLAVLEALACGIPVAGTLVGVIPELAPDAAIGVAPGDPGALAGALGCLLDDPGKRQALGQAGRARIESEYSVSRSVAGFQSLYEQAAKNHRS